MKLAILSDLHIDTNPWDPPRSLFTSFEMLDCIIIAGDISDNASDSIAWIGSHIATVPVLFVLGNHEYHKTETIEHGIQSAHEEAEKFSNIHILEREELTIGNTRFLGCNLWADFSYNGSKEENMRLGERMNPDHKHIRVKGENGLPQRFSAEKMLRIHELERLWIGSQLHKNSNNLTTVVITHFPPLPLSIINDPGAEHLASIMSADLSKLIEATQPDLWIHGHIHHRCDYIYKGTRILANPRGSPPYVNNNFRSMEIVSI